MEDFFVLSEQDLALFNKIYEATYKGLYNLSYSITKNKEDAEDALSDTYLGLAMQFDIVKDWEMTRIKGYLVGIIRHKSYDIIYKRIKVDDNRDVETDLTEIAEERKNITANMELKEILALLPDQERDLLYMADILELSIKSIAASLGINEETVKKRIQRARSKLKRRLRHKGE